MILPRSCSRVREWTRALFYTRLWPQSEPGISQEALAGRLRREPLAAAVGGREARPGREQGKGLMPGHPQLCVLKGWGWPWPLNKWAWRPQLLLPML